MSSRTKNLRDFVPVHLPGPLSRREIQLCNAKDGDKFQRQFELHAPLRYPVAEPLLRLPDPVSNGVGMQLQQFTGRGRIAPCLR